MLRRYGELLTVFITGGLIYGGLEVICRGHTYISMGVIGGICMVILHFLNDERRQGTSIAVSVTIGWIFIVSIELFSGEILNRTLKLHIWSYNSSPLNFDGQICLVFSILWYILSFVGLLFDEFIRSKLFHNHHIPILARYHKYI